MSSKSIIKKSNHLVNARFDFSVLEIRLFTLMVSQINNDDADFKSYKIPVQDFIRSFNIKNKNIYKELEKTTDSLIKKIIRIPVEEWGEKKLFKTSLVNSFKYNINGSGVIEASFHPDLKPYLLQLKNRYLLYDMKNVLHISSSNSIRMYELLKAFEGLWKRTFELEELKEILGVWEKYQRYYNFKKGILFQAQKDLKKYTDISFTFDEIKVPGSKRIHKIVFYINWNRWSTSEKLTVNNSIHSAKERSDQSGFSKLKTYKFSDSVITNLIKAKYEDNYVDSTLSYCEQYFKKANVSNKEGFILKALEKGFFKDQIEKDQNIKEATKKHETEKEEHENISKAFNNYVIELTSKAVEQLSPDELVKYKDEFLNEVNTNSFFKKALDAYGFDHKIIQGQRQLFLSKKLLSEEQRSIEEFSKTTPKKA